eukprot:TRINITY_DN1188_c0_g1_i1.p1 TRINITY_DN1188_c0_g1~~TRINITY_DN1188_c0_g1_i1.p1  ORF type:complete len:378 (+),score=100.49 TRINITY_DN1188_c0_g1_i1:38-1171(+)
MADDKYYCGCGHSIWGMLLLFSVVQVFLTSSLFPGIVEIFDASVAVRSARTNVESAAAAVDATRTVTSNSTAYMTTLSYAPGSGANGILMWESAAVAPSNYQVLNLNYMDAMLRTTAVYNRYFSFSKSAAWADINIQSVASKVDPNSGATLAVDIYLVPSTSFYFANSNNVRVTASAAAQKLGNLDFSTYQNVSLNVYTAYEKKVSAILTDSLVRTEAFAGFFFLQWIVGLAFFGLALKHYQLQSVPTVLPILATVGLLFMFLGWVVGWFYNSPWTLTSLFSTYLTTSGSTFTEYAATPYVGLLILNWVLLLIYSNYTVAFVNSGGKEELETPAYTGQGTTFTNTFKQMTGRFTGSSAGRPTTTAGETKTEDVALAR